MSAYELGLEVPMTRDGVVWRAWDVSSEGGMLLLPHKQTRSLAELLLCPAAELEIGEFLGAGNEGKVFAHSLKPWGELAIKSFIYEDKKVRQGPLGTKKDLLVNYALYHGLKKLQQCDEWRIRAPELYGAFIPHDTSNAHEQESLPKSGSRWAMERINHLFDRPERIAIARASSTFPSFEQRGRLYDTAVYTVGIDGLDPLYDDCDELKNVLIEELPHTSKPGEPGSLVAIDAYHYDEA